MNQSVSPSIPEPPPKLDGHIVPDALIHVLQKLRDTHSVDALIHLVSQRDAFGRAKYGQPLMSNDGRNGIEDARQELGDLLQYVMKCKMAGDDLSEFVKLLETAMSVIRVIVD